MSAGTTCVVHLVRAVNGPAPFERFLASYRQNPGGHPHRLLLVMKGFRGGDDLAPYGRMLADIPHERLFVRDFGFDVRAYLIAARRTHHDLYCFLNSFSVIQDGDWLRKLASHAGRGERDVVSATGAWTSHYSQNVEDPRSGRWFRLAGRTCDVPAALAPLTRRAWLWRLRRRFDPFPNFHVRTNAFLIGRSLLLDSAPHLVLSKFDAFLFESGHDGLSARCRSRGGRLIVVGRDGKAHFERDWPESNTFWQGAQENLLVQDNQTMRYQRSGLEERRTLARIVWGDRAHATDDRLLPAAGRDRRTREGE